MLVPAMASLNSFIDIRTPNSEVHYIRIETSEEEARHIVGEQP